MKFKEPRLLLICLIAFLGMLCLAIQSIMEHNMAQLMMTLLLSLIALSMALARFNIILQRDFMLIYVFKYIGIFPVMVDYQDLLEVKQCSKRKIKIKTNKHDYTFYTLNASKLVGYLKKQTMALELEIHYV